MECPLSIKQKSDGPFAEENRAKQRFYSEVQIPEECWPCVYYARSLPEEFVSSESEEVCTHSEDPDESVDYDLSLVIIPGTPHRYIEEETSLEYGCSQDVCSGALGRFVTRFDCRLEI